MSAPKRERHQEPESDPLQMGQPLKCEHDLSQERPSKCDLAQDHHEPDQSQTQPSVSWAFAGPSILWPFIKRLFQHILLWLHILGSTPDFQVEKQKYLLKKRVIIRAQLPGIKDPWSAALPSGKPLRETATFPARMKAFSLVFPILRVPAFWKPVGNPRVGEEPLPTEQPTASKI